MAGQTGPMLARFLDRPCASSVFRLGFSDHGDGNVFGASGLTPVLDAQREREGGVVEDLLIPMPAVAAIQSGFYHPRYPSLSHMLKAKSKPVTEIEADSISDSFTRALPLETLSDMVEPDKTRQGRVVKGSLDEQITAFSAFLIERGLL